MKKTLLLLFSLLFATGINAENDYSKYYKNLPVEIPEVSPPVIPDNIISIVDFGGSGDGFTDNTEAFKKAMSALSNQGGGQLNVPAGIYLTGLISFKDNIDLHLEKNAIIVFSPDKKNMFKDKEDGTKEDKTSTWITASNRKNISITGEGVIDGNGEWWRPVKKVKVSSVEWKKFTELGGTLTEDGKIWYPYNIKHFDNVGLNKEEQEKFRTHLIRFTGCENVLVQGVTLMNSPKFHFIPTRCKNVIIDGITVKCPWNAQNGDAIDLSSCQNVLIVNNIVDAGDDGICMKAGVGEKGIAAGPVKNVIIEDNHVYNAHGGFVVGSEFSGGLENIVVRNNTFTGTETGLRFKSAIKRGGTCKNVFISNIYMTDIQEEAIVFETTYWDNHVGAKKQAAPEKVEFAPDFNDIHIENVYVRGCKTGIKAQGAEGMIHDIYIKNSNIFYTDKDKDIAPTCELFLDNVNFKTFDR